MKTELVHNLSFEAYRASEGLSKHTFDTFCVAPAMYLHRVANPIQPSRSMVMGTLIHASALEGEILYAAGPKVDRRTKAGKEEWEAFCMENAGKEIVTQEEAQIIQGVTESVRPLIDKHCGTDMLIESSMYWGRQGIQCKGRPDLIGTFDGKPAIVDLKTTQDIAAFDKKFYHFKYDVQAEWYSWGAGTVMGVFPDFYFLAVDTEPPYLAQFVLAAPRTIANARLRTEIMLDKYAECQKTGDFTMGLPELREI